MSLVSNLLHHYQSNEYAMRAELQHTAPGLCSAFRSVLGRPTQTPGARADSPLDRAAREREQLAHDEYLLLTSMAESAGQVTRLSAAYGLYRFEFDDEASRLDFLDHRVRKQLRETVFELMGEFREARAVAHSWQTSEGAQELHVRLSVEAVARQHMIRYGVPEPRSSLAEDLPVLVDFVNKVCSDMRELVRDQANWPVPGEDERLKAQELSHALFSGLTAEQLRVLRQHPECVGEALERASQQVCL